MSSAIDRARCLNFSLSKTTSTASRMTLADAAGDSSRPSPSVATLWALRG
jgi:hypothetical protein